MKIFWYNDTNKVQSVFLDVLTAKPIIIQPRQAEEIDVELLAEEQIFIKQWPKGKIFVSKMKRSNA